MTVEWEGCRCRLEERERSGRVLEREQENEDLEGGGGIREQKFENGSQPYI